MESVQKTIDTPLWFWEICATHGTTKSYNMRTKALILSAVLGVAMVATSLAQVYSVNAVGYVNKTIPTGLSMIANPLQAPINDLNHVLTVPGGTQIYKFNGVGFDSIIYDDLDGKWLIGAVDYGATTFAPGEGAFIRAPSVFTNTFVGDVIQGSAATGNPVTVALPAGLSIVSSKVPITGLVSTDLKFPQIGGAQLYVYNGTGYDSYLFDDLDLKWTPSEPTIAIGQSFWARMPAATSWVRDFTVN
jgi:hypothetical protein